MWPVSSVVVRVVSELHYQQIVRVNSQITQLLCYLILTEFETTPSLYATMAHISHYMLLNGGCDKEVKTALEDMIRDERVSEDFVFPSLFGGLTVKLTD